MTEPRVSDEMLEDLCKAVWLAKGQTLSSKNREHHQAVQWALMDLQDARAQLQHQANLQCSMNKEPE